MKAAHHRGTYHVRSRQLLALAYANPDTRCMTCHRILADCRPHRNGKPAKWTAGHVNAGEVGGELRPECSPCNLSDGARQSGRNNTSRNW